MIRRNTIQRSLVYEAVNNLKCHASADEIYAEIVRKYPTIGRGTVYRNLNQLAENGDIKKIEIPGGADRYDHNCHDHYHVRCLKCGSVFDMDMEYITDLEKSVRDTRGFYISGHDIIFKGICSECRNES